MSLMSENVLLGGWGVPARKGAGFGTLCQPGTSLLLCKIFPFMKRNVRFYFLPTETCLISVLLFDGYSL
jgi:hypothetical protein